MVYTLNIKINLKNIKIVIAIFRCVPENQRAYALGIQFLFMRSLSFIPGPVIFGAVIDSQCTLWSEDNCGQRGNCLDYNIDKLSLNIVYLGVVTGGKYKDLFIHQNSCIYIFNVVEKYWVVQLLL